MRIPPKHILVPTDFGDSAEVALDYAIALAKPIGATITLLHAYEIPVIGFPDGTLVAPSDIAASVATAAQVALDANVAKRKDCGVKVEGMLRTGDARSTIDAVANEASVDLVVMGTHGRRGLSRVLLGSVAEYVVRTSPAPVLVVRSPKALPVEKS